MTLGSGHLSLVVSGRGASEASPVFTAAPHRLHYPLSSAPRQIGAALDSPRGANPIVNYILPLPLLSVEKLSSTKPALGDQKVEDGCFRGGDLDVRPDSHLSELGRLKLVRLGKIWVLPILKLFRFWESKN